MSLRAARLPRWATFLGANALAGLALAVLVVMPLAQRFTERRAAMAEDLGEVGRLDDQRGRMRVLSARLVGPGSPVLPTTDERLGSADLQALLQEAARSAAATFLGVRGLPATRRPDLKLVAARLDLEGPPAAVAATLRAIEDHVPLLRVTNAVLRGATGDAASGGPLRAELQVEAALAGSRALAADRSPDGARP